MELVSQLSGQIFRNSMELIESTKIRLSPRFLTYYPVHRISVKSKRYELKTAETMNELVSVFKLRYQNFLENCPDANAVAYDVDEFDHICDHLIIKCNATGDIVGTYRILCSRYTSSFYSQNEFVLDDFLKDSGVKLELGRVCIEPSHRNGRVIDLLWKGIGQYADLTQAQFLFGCSSVKVTAPNRVKSIMNNLDNDGHLGDQYDIYPEKKFAMPIFLEEADSFFCIEDLVPPLLKSYINAGAKVYGKPALDKEFECVDLMTILNLNDLTRLFKKRYFSESAA